ncbi:Crp/Fnr family transcriptional regulator [Frateuria sp. MAH-13]|uniref:Crp/Fnr family transcriptional regulator n=1 Tax=Frateuria flava TaxID=2821489 RepID=A0ABS4DJA6_9GAMM|nr:Crp/Fnr family transcriptional regulator [Frateuria flava]
MALPGKSAPNWSANSLLGSLSLEDMSLLAPHLLPWYGEPADVLYAPGDNVGTVYFPCGPSLVSYRVMLDDGRGVETALVGREGAVGGIVSHGRLPAFAHALVQFPGLFYRMRTGQLEQAKISSPTLRLQFARYADCMVAQVFQSVACNAAHTIEQRAAKWLIAALDRTGDGDVPLTQEQLASMLGVGRSYISRVVQNMRLRGVLETRRGTVKVHDMAELQRMSCRCNDTVRRHFGEVLKGVYPSDDDSVRTGKAQPPPGTDTTS